MLRVALVLRSTDVRPDFLVLHVFFVHLFCLIMSFAGNRTPGPQWWLWNRALHHLHSNSFKLVHFQTHDIDCRSVCVCRGAQTRSSLSFFHMRGLDCHCVPVGTHSHAWHQLSLCARGHTLVQACPFHTRTHTHTIDCHRAPVDTHSFNVALFPYTALSVIVCPWTHIRLSLL